MKTPALDAAAQRSLSLERRGLGRGLPFPLQKEEAPVSGGLAALTCPSGILSPRERVSPQ